jgi:hypothetical protein
MHEERWQGVVTVGIVSGLIATIPTLPFLYRWCMSLTMLHGQALLVSGEVSQRSPLIHPWERPGLVAGLVVACLTVIRLVAGVLSIWVGELCRRGTHATVRALLMLGVQLIGAGVPVALVAEDAPVHADRSLSVARSVVDYRYPRGRQIEGIVAISAAVGTWVSWRIQRKRRQGRCER